MVGRLSRLVLLVVASVALFVGLSGAIVFAPGVNMEIARAHGAEADTSGEIKWEKSFLAGSKIAMENKKYILADVYTDWCGWCKRLDRDVFPDKKVVSFLQNDFVCVKVNAEDPAEGRALAEKYNVNSYPCALVFNSDGKLLGRIEGYEKPSQYVSSVKRIVSGKGE